MFFLTNFFLDLILIACNHTKSKKINEMISIKAILFLFISTLTLDAANIKIDSKKLSDAMVYSDAGMWNNSFDLVEGIPDDSVQDLIQWLKLRDGEGSKLDYINFIKENPHWPGMRLLRLKAERRIYEDYRKKRINIDESILVLFPENRPQTGEGLFLFAEIISRIGETEETLQSLFEQWLIVEFSDVSFKEFTEKFLKKYDLKYSKRVEELLWNRKTSSVEQLLKISKYKMSNTDIVRLKLQKQEKNVTKYLSNLTVKEANHPGVIFDRFRYRISKNFLDSASEYILANSKQGLGILGRANKWSHYRSRLVKHNLAKSKTLDAYEIARNHYLQQTERNYYQLEWMAGFIAYYYLNKYELALSHFQNSYEVAGSSESKAKVKYFLGKTFEAMNRDEESKSAFLEASEYIDTIHGQVSYEILNIGEDDVLSVIEPKDPPIFGSILTLDTVRLGLLLSYARRTVLGDWFFQNSAKFLNAQEKADLIKSLNSTGHHMSVISIVSKSKTLRENAVNENYPIPSFWEVSDSTIEPLYLAIAREESKFYIGSRSSTGAEGLMQLMPKTAEMMAIELGLPYLPSRLRVDWKYNVKLGANYIKKLMKRYDYSLPLALAGYNAGPGRVNEWLKIYGDPRENEIDMLNWIQCIPFDETRGYVSRVLAAITMYEGILRGGSLKLDSLDQEFLFSAD